MTHELFTILNQGLRPKILVLGDAMLDRYTWGDAERVSPEAPVVVLRADQREVRLGGAASVAVLLRALEAEATLATVTGDDHDGRTIRRLLDEAGINAYPVLIDPSRPTTTKERFLGRSDQRQSHQMLRVDTESRSPLDEDLTRMLLNLLSEQIPQHAAVLISDYAKGVCTERLMSEVIGLCRASDIPVLVDPGRGTDFAVYRGATLIKPNRLEAELATGVPIRSPEAALNAARQLREQYEIKIVVITLDSDGLVYATAEESQHLPTTVQEICDITGAGDTVLATLGLALAATPIPSPRYSGERARVRGSSSASHDGLPMSESIARSASDTRPLKDNGTDATKTADAGTEKKSPHPTSPHKAGARSRTMTSNTTFRGVAALANAAAGLQVAQPGVTPISRTDLRKQVEKSSPVGPSTGKPIARNPRTAQDPNSVKQRETPSN